MMFVMIDKAREFALTMHAGQRYGSQPYGVHLKSVATKVGEWGGSYQHVAAAWLHDVLEDTMDPLPMDMKKIVLVHGFGVAVADIVWACTGTHPSRNAAFEEQMKKISDLPSAMLVKAADRWSNMKAVTDDLEFETDHVKIHRLCGIGHHYLTEWPRFSQVLRQTLPYDTVENQLNVAHNKLKGAVERHG